MTTLHYAGIDTIYQQLSRVDAARQAVRVVRGALVLLAAVAASLLAMGAGAGYWPDQPPSALRWGLLACAIAAWLSAGGYLVACVLWRQTPAQTARHIEQNLPELRNDLINSVLLAGEGSPPSAEFVQAAITEAVLRARHAEISRSVSRRSLRWPGVAACAAVALAAGFALFQPGPMRRGLAAAFMPTGYVATVNDVELVSLHVVCGDRQFGPDAALFAGDQATIVVSIANDAAVPYHAELLIEGNPNPRPMLATEGNSTYTCSLGAMEQSLRYAVRVGKSRWPSDRAYYSIDVLRRVQVVSARTIYAYPPYTRLPKRTVDDIGAIEAPQGSAAEVTLTLSAPAPAVNIELQDGGAWRMTSLSDGVTFSGVIPVDKDGAYRLAIQDHQGRTLQQLPDSEQVAVHDASGLSGRSLLAGHYRIRALPDAKPKIEFASPNKDVALPPGGKLPVQMRIWDDYCIEHVQFFVGPEGQERPVTDLKLASAVGTNAAYLPYTLHVGSEHKKGDVLLYYATVTDGRQLPGAGPQTSISSKFKVLVQDAAEVAAERAKRYEELRRRLMAVLRIQETQRVSTERCALQLAELTAVQALAKEIEANQKKIVAEFEDLLSKFPFEPEMAAIQQALGVLVANEAPQAAALAGSLAQVASLDARAKPCASLAQKQDRIIDTLQTLLAVMPSLAARAQEAASSSQPAGNLPPDVKEKLEQLKANLEEFIKEQKKVVEASERLSKKPVDNFDDAKLLKDLQAAQDKWEKFLNEAFTDFSKMAQQDFSNPSLLKELLSVKTDVTMAKDALAKKATEIATAVEENGIENAKELTANIEKWLPDEPDRAKWSMEDPAGGQDKVEAPELPKELEDLVGDLLEQEEDLFEEIEDVTSKYNMSGDKGIGWDAMDGPISSMNAQGVTGNQLPNNMELSGRSGEGREGKSTGEFVQDTAEGKGGRRTPTRLTPEPFQKGQVDDKSQEPPGGSTGGGKLSGAGGEGLEGPVPPPLQKELQRLAGKQAALVNQAQKVKEQFKQSDYSGFNKAITLMNRVEEDLAANRYQNALRQRDVTVGALQQAHLLLTGKIEVQSDQSTAMPKYVRDDIADAMKGKLPAEYREALEQYYKRLSEAGAAQ